jgi:hypothetical protein
LNFTSSRIVLARDLCHASTIPMATWIACIVETKGRADFWDVARRLGVRPDTNEVPPYALIDTDCGLDFMASIRLAEDFSRELSSMTIGFVVQTNTDVHVTRTFVNGVTVRRMEYNREGGGWGIVEGEPQMWESLYFFDDEESATFSQRWPDMLEDVISDADRDRFAEARRLGDPTLVMDLLHPSSTAGMWRVCELFGIEEGDHPAGVWKRPSMLSRLRLKVGGSSPDAARALDEMRTKLK